MKEAIKFPFSHPNIKQMVLACYPEAKGSRKPVRVETKTSYFVQDYWDGGSRLYCHFLRLSDMKSVSSEALPEEARQQEGNPYHLAVGTVLLLQGWAVIEHSIFCGKDTGYRIYLHSDDVSTYFPEINNAQV